MPQLAEDWIHEWIMNGRVRESMGECRRVRESAGECGRVRRVNIEGKLMDSIIYAGIAKREGRN